MIELFQIFFVCVFHILTPQLLPCREKTAATQSLLDKGWNRWLMILYCPHIREAPWLRVLFYFYFF